MHVRNKHKFYCKKWQGSNKSAMKQVPLSSSLSHLIYLIQLYI